MFTDTAKAVIFHPTTKLVGKIVAAYEGGVVVASTAFRKGEIVPMLKDAGTFGYTMFRDMRNNRLHHTKETGSSKISSKMIASAAKTIKANLERETGDLAKLVKETKETNKASQDMIKQWTKLNKDTVDLQAKQIELLEKAGELHVKAKA